jgi:hypothetical protein
MRAYALHTTGKALLVTLVLAPTLMSCFGNGLSDAELCPVGLCPKVVCAFRDAKYTCGCENGYKRSDDGRRCVDIDECAGDTPACDAHAYCSNTIGTSLDKERNGAACSCICLLSMSPTPGSEVHAILIVLPLTGSFVCTCNDGFVVCGTELLTLGNNQQAALCLRVQIPITQPFSNSSESYVNIYV